MKSYKPRKSTNSEEKLYLPIRLEVNFDAFVLAKVDESRSRFSVRFNDGFIR